MFLPDIGVTVLLFHQIFHDLNIVIEDSPDQGTVSLQVLIIKVVGIDALSYEKEHFEVLSIYAYVEKVVTRLEVVFLKEEGLFLN